MKATLFIRHDKKLIKAFDIDAPDHATFLNIPLEHTRFTVTGSESSTKVLTFKKLKTEFISAYFLGNVFICDIPKNEPSDLAL